jgi:hypothetical protein
VIFERIERHTKISPQRKNITKRLIPTRQETLYPLQQRLPDALFPRTVRLSLPGRFVWQDMARQLLKKVEVGNLSYEGFEAAIRLPHTK